MRIAGRWRRSIEEVDGGAVIVLDQTKLPFAVEELTLRSEDDCARAIRTMEVRGAPLIGVVGAYGLVFALEADSSDESLAAAFDRLFETRPTAVNLGWALRAIREHVQGSPIGERAARARTLARRITDEDAAASEAIGRAGLEILRARWEVLGRPERLHVLTHCNAGWLATVDWGTALAPIYMAHDAGLPVHVWVDETRPRSQGLLTAFELRSHGVPCTYVSDNAGGHLMQHGLVHACIVGCDRVTRRGDACNKIGTYLKALAASAHGVPFYVAMPWSTFDPRMDDGVREVPIEDRSGAEVRLVHGVDGEGRPATVRILEDAQPVANPAFDVTPAALVTAFLTERGVFRPEALAGCAASTDTRGALAGPKGAA
jgi:methylthioribose-1-phosphate isomerase